MKNHLLGSVHLCFSSILFFLLHLPVVFAKVVPSADAVSTSSITTLPDLDNNVSSLYSNNAKLLTSTVLYDSLKLNSIGLSKQVFEYALKGYSTMKLLGKIENSNVISIVDFSKPSNLKRLFVIDLKNYKVLFNTYVAHGVNSGTRVANQFSNIPETYKSSLGFYKTTNTYIGKHGYSLHLMGLEKGVNDKAFERDIVIHGAGYVSEDIIKSQGYIGRSWGCPAISEQLHKPIIDKIKNGTCLFIYSPDLNYLSQSKLLNNNLRSSLLSAG